MSARILAFLFAIMATGFLVVSQIYAIIPLLGSIAVDYQISGDAAAFVVTAFGLSYAAGFFLSGPLADKMDRLKLLVVGLALMAVATMATAFSPNFWWLLGGRIMQGFAAATFPPAALAMIGEEVPPHARPLAISMLGLAFLSAAPLSQFLVTLSGLSFPVLLQIAAAFYLMSMTLIWFTGQRVRNDSGIKTSQSGSAAKVDEGKSSRYPGIIPAVIVPTTVLFGFVSFHAAVQFLSRQAVEIDPQLLRLAGLPPLLFTFAAAPITSRYGPAITAVTGMLITGLGLSIAASGTLLLSSVVLSAGVALTVPGLIATVSSWSSNSARGKSLATYTFFLFSGASLAPPASELLITMNSGSVFVVPAFFSFTAAILLYLALKQRISRQPASTTA